MIRAGKQEKKNMSQTKIYPVEFEAYLTGTWPETLFP